jgi:ABC-type multidrug transport system permease subunit
LKDIFGYGECPLNSSSWDFGNGSWNFSIVSAYVFGNILGMVFGYGILPIFFGPGE